MKLLRLLKAGLQKVFGITFTPKENALAKALERECVKLEQRERQLKKPSVVAKTANRKKNGSKTASVSSVQPSNRRKRVRLADKSGGGAKANTPKRKSSSSGKGSK